MKRVNTLILIFFITCCNLSIAQNVPILGYSLNNSGQVQLEIDGQADQYYILTALHEPSLNYESTTSITMGIDGPMIITEPLAAYPLQSYKITGHSIANPDDTDGDGIDDISEYNNMPSQAPLNFAGEVPFVDGATSLTDGDVYSDLAVVSTNIPWAPFLNNQEFAKFAILNQDSNEPEVYFINSVTHDIHASFLGTINTAGAQIVTGEIVYNPNEIMNGTIGSYSFNYSFGNAYTFEHTQRTFELLAANMPFLTNNFKHFIGSGGEADHENIFQNGFVGSRIVVDLETDVFADVDFIPFNQAEGYGFFREMQLDENPASRDIVLYDALPNSLPRVGGIITSVVQTPLSHVNLRAIQDNVPNAYIKEPLMIDSIANLLGKYIYYKVEQDQYIIREATLDEVNLWYENLRPTEEQIPDRDLTQTSILPLDSIGFNMANAFGAKCSNVATMRNFGFPEGTIPDGFGIPFYFYDEFMKFNGFYDQVAVMIADDDFINDLQTRIDMLKDFRSQIKAADMPQWMLDELQAMHDQFPVGTSVRCRSSTNNEDLPGFSGAGLYTSKTQHPDEGHISKSVKQVYASMWNFRAYDERDFYRVDQYIAAMGILCHPNYQDEKSNGVGVSIDPIFNTENTFYLNTQVGESLITNPDANSIPEEILLNTDPAEGYFVLRYSNLVGQDELVMEEIYLDQMRTFLGVIHDEFEILYNVQGAEGFGMDIEYKVTVDDQLIIKQARPWVSFWSEIKSNYDLAVVEITNPITSSTLGDAELVSAVIGNQGLKDMNDFEIKLLVNGQEVESISISDTLNPQTSAEYQFTIPQDLSMIGDYEIGVVVLDTIDGYSRNDTLINLVKKVHFLEGGLVAALDEVKCGEKVEVLATVTNYGEAIFNDTEIEVVVNGLIVDTVSYGFSIPYLVEISIPITVTENLMLNDNEIQLNLLKVNGSTDAVADNNSSTIFTSLISDSDYITFIINADNYPQETSWQIFDDSDNELVASGSLTSGVVLFEEEICLDYNSCFTLVVSDTYGDGICCGFGQGDFLVLNSDGDTLVTNDGDFGSSAEEMFCPIVCGITAEVNVTNAENQDTNDGVIAINPSNGIEPYEYSIDGGQNFSNTNTFTDLAPGIYEIMVQGAVEGCFYEETIVVDYDILINVEDLILGSIKLYPNPTYESFVIEIDETIEGTGNLTMEIYNGLGKLIRKEDHLKFDVDSKSIISLSDYAAGAFIVKCYNEDFEKYFKVIKF